MPKTIRSLFKFHDICQHRVHHMHSLSFAERALCEMQFHPEYRLSLGNIAFLLERKAGMDRSGVEPEAYGAAEYHTLPASPPCLHLALFQRAIRWRSTIDLPAPVLIKWKSAIYNFDGKGAFACLAIILSYSPLYGAPVGAFLKLLGMLFVHVCIVPVYPDYLKMIGRFRGDIRAGKDKLIFR